MDSRADFARLHALDRELISSTPTRIGSENPADNRYGDVLPYDHTLPASAVERYINANVIKPLEGPSEYIATQGPMPHTFDRFFDLAVEKMEQDPHRCVNVIMLTELADGGRRKADDYLGHLRELLHASLERNNLAGSTLSRVHLSQWDSVEVREVEITLGEQQWTFRHLWVRNWLDNEPPTSSISGNIYDEPLIKLSMKLQIWGGYKMVHCSAGVGRTGTFIALDYYLNHYDAYPDMFHVVASMKRQRFLMVQTQGQLNWLYNIVYKLKQSV